MKTRKKILPNIINSRYASILSIGLILTFSSYLALRDIHLQQETINEKSFTMISQVEDAINQEIQKRLDILDLFIQTWVSSPNIEDLYSSERFEVIIPNYYNVTPGFKAINWIDINGTIRWIYPYEDNLPALNKSIVYLKGDLYNAGFNYAQRHKEMGVMGVFELYQGGFGFTTYIPLLYNSTVTGYLNGVFDLNILFGEIFNSDYGFVNIDQYGVQISFKEESIFNQHENFTLTEKFVISKKITILNSFDLILAIRPIQSIRESVSLKSNLSILIIGFTLAIVVGILIKRLFEQNDELRVSSQEKQELMQELHIRQKFESLGTLAGGIAHDFNNLLGAIQGNIDIFDLNLSELEKNENNSDQKTIQEMHQDLAEIEQLIFKSGKLINQITQFSPSPSNELKPLNFTEFVSDSLKGFRKMIDRRIRVTSHFNHEKVYILADKSKFNQMLLNLWINARDAIEPNVGKISITTSVICKNKTPLKPIEARFYPLKNTQSLIYNPDLELEISISDTGKGIPEELLEKIFDPFFTTKDPSQRGTGLGLTIAFKVIQSMDGTISVESKIGKGTTFHLHLPILQPDIILSPQTIVDHKIDEHFLYDFHDFTVMIVEDELLIRKSVQKYLEKSHATVYAAGSGFQGLQLYKTFPNQFDLVILDINLPEISGIELYRTIKSIFPLQHTLFITGFSESGIPSLDSSDLGVLTKPFEMHAMGKKIHDFFQDNSCK